MPDYQVIKQGTFVKGLNSSTDIFDQPRGTLPKLSNMMLSIRGALRSIFGGQTVASYQANGQQLGTSIGAIKKLFQSVAVQFSFRQYWLLADCQIVLTPSFALAAVGTNVMGGTLLPSTTYAYSIALVDDPNAPASGHIGPFAFITVTTGPSDNAVILTWNGLPGPFGYIVTGRTPGFNNFLTIVPNVTGPEQQTPSGPVFNPAIQVTLTDTGSLTPGAIVTFGGSNLMNVVALMSVVAYSPSTYGYDPLGSFADGAVMLFPQGPTKQAFPPIGGGPIVTSNAFSPCGGVAGETEATPDLNEFANDLIVILGNGYILHIVDLSGANFPGPIVNTFAATYPEFQASSTYLLNDNVVPTVANGYFYTCTQPGVAGTEPAWPVVVGDTVTTGQCIFQCAGLVTNSPPPPGAAHAIYYAGSLWVLNTSPTNTSDGLSGPSALQMSDINNPNSWNPINQAFIGKDDGSEGMGLAQFTIAEVGIPPTGSLVIFKNFSSYQIIGVFGATDFAIQAIQTDMGCIAPRSIQFISGYGIVRLAHLGFAIFDGVRDRLISEDIRPYLYSDSPSQTGALPALDWTYAYLAHGSQVVNPPMYICAIPVGNSNGKMSRLCCYDLVLKSWIIVDLPTLAIPMLARSISQIRSPGSQPLTLVGSASDTTIFRMFYGDGTWIDGSTLVAWSFTTPEVYNQQASGGRIYIKKVRIRGRYLDGHNISGLPITVYLDLNGDDAVGGIEAEAGLPSYNYSYQLSDNPNGFIVEVDVNETVVNAHAIISGQGNVEIDFVEWYYSPKPTNVPPNLMGS